MAYVNPKVTAKRDALYKKSHPTDYRFHEFVRLRVLSVSDSTRVYVYNMEDKTKSHVILRNMDAFFYLNDKHRVLQEDRLCKISV